MMEASLIFQAEIFATLCVYDCLLNFTQKPLYIQMCELGALFGNRHERNIRDSGKKILYKDVLCAVVGNTYDGNIRDFHAKKLHIQL